ncbi:hypothetical protein [Pseudonocardia alni]|uniref:hypothetical protein n=1 Tax=Pseudonocardia alni TaxID=33907 RepID=UPI0027A6A5B1|nr:hypothetical protein PaSha_14165 [Pseudonocardia alni]WFG47467.1 hypothetical protein PaSha_28715 [Pseudonocardia alni]
MSADVAAPAFLAPAQRPSISEALDQLARQEDIAAYLIEHGHRGVIGEPDACPVHQYLYAATGHEVSVDAPIWRADTGEDDYDRGTLPGSILGFICRFDLGKHPELER